MPAFQDLSQVPWAGPRERDLPAKRPCRVAALRFALLIAGVITSCGGGERDATRGAPSPRRTTQQDGEMVFPMGKASSAITCAVEPGAYCTAGCEVRCPGKQRAICTLGTRACSAAAGCSCEHESSCRCQLL